MATATIKGQTVHYSDTGGDGPVIVLLHGFLMDRTMFAAQAAYLAPHWRVVRIDARGHGDDADAADIAFDYWDAADDVLGLLDTLGIQDAVIGGMSQGGFIALRTALRAPSRVRGLVLIATEAAACTPDQQRAYRDLFDALAAHGPSEQLIAPLARQIIGDSPHAARWQRRWQQQPRLPLGAPATCLIERDTLLESQLAGIHCPALLIWGSQDSSLPRAQMEELDRLLPGRTELLDVPGAAHAVPLTHPAPVNRAIKQFLLCTAGCR